MKYPHLILLFLFVAACPDPMAGASASDNKLGGDWYAVYPPPGHSDQTCWVWKDYAVGGAYGGPVCFSTVMR